MSPLHQAWPRFRALFRKRQWEEDMAEEMRLHLEQRIEEAVAAGLSPEEARFAAQRQFGGIEQIKELAREQHGMAWVEHIGQDLRYGARMLRKQPGFATVAVLTLALGIGATTAIFSVVNGVLLRPLNYSRAHELTLIAEVSSRVPQAGVSPGALAFWRQQAKSFTALAAWTYGPYNLTGVGEPLRVYDQRVTPGYFAVLDVHPALGREFRPAEGIPGRDNVAILSHGLWQKQFGGRSTVIGQAIMLDERRFVIIGVMPENFQFDRRADIYTPCTFTAQDRENFAERDVLVLGRLKRGVTPAQAREEMAGLARQLAQKYPASNQSWSVMVLPLLEATVGNVRPLLLLLLGAVGFLLLIACVNVANLLLARASTRQREMAVRVALGAGRGRIMRQLLCESLLIAALGGGLGVIFGYGGLHVLLAFAPEGLPRLEEISMDGHVLVFASLLAFCTGLGFGLAPALEATAVNAVETLKDGGHGLSDGRRRRRLRSTLVILEVGLALILLSGAGRLARSFFRLQQVDLGFQTRDLYMNNIALIPQKYPGESARAAFVEEAMARLTALPGIQAAAFTNHTLPTLGMGRTFFTIAGRSLEPMQLPPAFYYAVTPDYFRIFGIPLVRGRTFTAQDVAGAPRVVLINQKLAQLHFPDSDPIGQQLSVGNGPDTWREIIGVVGDTKQNGPGQPTRGQIYEPYAQSPTLSTSVVVHSTLSIPELQVAVGAAIHGIDQDIPLSAMYGLFGSLDRSLVATRFALYLFGVFAVTALFLAAIGVYGVMTYVVNQRTGEIGLRMALGAQRSDVLWLIFRQGIRMVGTGLLVGLAGTFALSHALDWMLFEASPYDPLMLAVIVLVLAFAAFFACWVPARRATRVDPMTALRAE